MSVPFLGEFGFFTLPVIPFNCIVGNQWNHLAGVHWDLLVRNGFLWPFGRQANINQRVLSDSGKLLIGVSGSEGEMSKAQRIMAKSFRFFWGGGSPRPISQGVSFAHQTFWPTQAHLVAKPEQVVRALGAEGRLCSNSAG